MSKGTRGWQINAMGIGVLILIVGFILDKYGHRILDMLEYIIKSIFQ